MSSLCLEQSLNRTQLSQPLHERLLRTSPLYFGQTYLRGPSWAPFNGRYLVGPHHIEWQRIVCECLRFAVMAARGTGKSYFFAFLWPLWLATLYPGKQFLLVSSTDENSKKLLRAIREEVEDNPALQWLFPAGKASRIWRSHDLSFSNGFSIVARSAMSRIRGYHPNWVHCDDAVTDEAAYSEAYRIRFKDFYFGVLSNMLMRGGVQGISGTPLSYKDLLSKDLKDNAEYEHSVWPVIDSQDKSIWPAVIPVAEIQRKRREMPSLLFSREQLCKPVSSDTSLFPRYLFTGPPVEQPLFTMGQPRDALTSAGLTLFLGVDLAFSTRASADYFVVLTIGLDGQGNRWIVDMHRSRGLMFREQLAILTEIGHKYRPEVLCIESNAAQRLFSAEMRSNTDLPIYEHNTGTEKHSFEVGLPAMQLLAELKKYRLGKGDEQTRQKVDVLLGEMEAFSYIDGKCMSLGEHDDTVMALLMTEHAIRRGSMFQSCLVGGEDKAHYVHRNAAEQPKQMPVTHGEMMARIQKLQGL